MTFPALRPRIEQGIEFALQQSGQVRAFCPVALRASIAKTIGIVCPSMLLGNDVLDLERKPASVFFM
jgi:hypothetical protein